MRLTDPKTMQELMADGWTRDQVYGAVKRGDLVNLNRLDAWGRIRRGPGLFGQPLGVAFRTELHQTGRARSRGRASSFASSTSRFRIFASWMRTSRWTAGVRSLKSAVAP